MINLIREHELQHFLVDYLVGPALNCFYMGNQGGTEVFRLETTTGFYELRLCDFVPSNDNAIPRLDGSRSAILRGKTAMILRTGANANTSYYFYKESGGYEG